MFELIAQGTNVDARWRRQIPEDAIEIGRASPTHRVPWDQQISRRHVRLQRLNKASVKVEKLSAASNPVFFNGNEVTEFNLAPGEHFVIGNTTFTLAADKAFVSLEVPNPISQKTFTHEFLQQVSYRDADRRIEVLNRIPEAISSAGNTEDLLIQMVNTLMAGISLASTVGIVRLDRDLETSVRPADSPDAIEIIQWDRRGFDRGDFQPSATLIRQAMETDESILHIWHQRKRVQSEYTYDYENDWAFVCPISSDASPGWGIYVAGINRGSGSNDSGSGEADLQGDVKFCELVGSTLKNLLLVQQLERQQSSLRAFFSPIVMEAFVGRDPDDVLTPRKCEMSVLFCDLRGFSKTSERMADDLLALLERVSDSMGIMTGKILDHGGVIGDFHGDSAMGFWGWPLEPTHHSLSALSAINAALEIQAAVSAGTHLGNDQTESQSFRVGLGIASGEAIAGKIGSRDQVKVTAFGPVVNLASRLEGMTRWLHSCILADGETVSRIQQTIPVEQQPTFRCMGVFQPFGLRTSFEVYQVFSRNCIPENALTVFQKALSEFQSGHWDQAKSTLQELPDEDSAGQFIRSFMAGFDGVPADWNGVVRMQAK